jgi:polyisoprenoid-binding protein YceI
MPEEGPRRQHRARRWLIAAIVVVVVLAVGIPFVYIHFIEGSAPAKLALPPSKGGGTGSGSTSVGSVDGTWHVGKGSVVGYRVQEVLIGQHTTAVGRSSTVSGSITISGTDVTAGAFTVNMASVVSDQSERNASFDGRIMDVAQYPTATLKLTAPIDLGTIPAVGATGTYDASGDLTMHGVTKPVIFTVSAERTSAGIDALADIPIEFSNWDIQNPSVGGLVTTADDGTLEALLHLTTGPGNAAVGSSSNSGANGQQGGGPGGPVTVPSTTVPPLKIPSGPAPSNTIPASS